MVTSGCLVKFVMATTLGLVSDDNLALQSLMAPKLSVIIGRAVPSGSRKVYLHIKCAGMRNDVKNNAIVGKAGATIRFSFKLFSTGLGGAQAVTDKVAH